jgi:hypothetical protein
LGCSRNRAVNAAGKLWRNCRFRAASPAIWQQFLLEEASKRDEVGAAMPRMEFSTVVAVL